MKHRNTRSFANFPLGKYRVHVWHMNKVTQTTDMDGNIVGTVEWLPHWNVQKLVKDFGRKPGGYWIQMHRLFVAVYL